MHGGNGTRHRHAWFGGLSAGDRRLSSRSPSRKAQGARGGGDQLVLRAAQRRLADRQGGGRRRGRVQGRGDDPRRRLRGLSRVRSTKIRSARRPCAISKATWKKASTRWSSTDQACHPRARPGSRPLKSRAERRRRRLCSAAPRREAHGAILAVIHAVPQSVEPDHSRPASERKRDKPPGIDDGNGRMARPPINGLHGSRPWLAHDGSVSGRPGGSWFGNRPIPIVPSCTTCAAPARNGPTSTAAPDGSSSSAGAKRRAEDLTRVRRFRCDQRPWLRCAARG